jgi:mono/diheme cytochrome c family protein
VERSNGARLRLAAAGLLLLAAAIAAADEDPGAASGDAARGRVLYTTTYKCYACHGYDAQTGERRLVPLNFTRDGFATFVQRSPLPQMPAYPDASDAELADIYAYIQSLPIDAPAVEEIPLLEDVLRSRATRDPQP